MDVQKYIEVLRKRTSGYDHVYDEYEKGELEYWDSGNFDDAFNWGVEVGIAQAIHEIINDLSGGQE